VQNVAEELLAHKETDTAAAVGKSTLPHPDMYLRRLSSTLIQMGEWISPKAGEEAVGSA
jgi:hypothetical protein